MSQGNGVVEDLLILANSIVERFSIGTIDERGEICAGLELNMIHLFYAALTVLQGKQDAKNDTFCL